MLKHRTMTGGFALKPSICMLCILRVIFIIMFEVQTVQYTLREIFRRKYRSPCLNSHFVQRSIEHELWGNRIRHSKEILIGHR